MCAVPLSRGGFPVRRVPGWRTLGLPLELWAAPMRFPGAVAEDEEASNGGTPPC